LVKIDDLLVDMWNANLVKKIYNNELLMQFIKDTWAYYIKRLRSYRLNDMNKLAEDPLQIKNLGKKFKKDFFIKALRLK
jgi:hypothetical protein